MTAEFRSWSPRQISDENLPASAVAAPSAAPLLPEDVRPWTPPSINNPAAKAASSRPEKPPASSDDGSLDATRQEAEERGYRDGLQRGEAEAHQLLVQQSQQLQLAMAALRNVTAQVDQNLEREVLELSVAMACQLLRRELNHDPGLLVEQIHDGVSALSGIKDHIEITLNPADLAILHQHFNDTGEAPEPHWQFLEDPRLSQGGFRLSGDSSRIDESLELRLATIIKSAFSGSPLLGKPDNGEHHD